MMRYVGSYVVQRFDTGFIGTNNARRGSDVMLVTQHFDVDVTRFDAYDIRVGFSLCILIL